MIRSDSTTFDLGQACLRLKDGLGFSIQQGRHGCWYLIEDESRSQFFRIGAAEYTFLSLLDGKTTMSSAMATTCSLLGASALDEQDAINLCKWLVDSGLAHTRASTSAGRLHEKDKERNAKANVQKLNPISIRIPLIELDSFTESAAKYFGWLVSWPMAIIWAITCLYGLVSIAMTWDSLGQVSVFSRDNVFWMIATWLVLKSIHEFAHVLACKCFGGKIGKGGILFLLMIPMPFVDVTSAWRFPNKYQRILTSAAGMMLEMFIAAIAAIIWANTSPGALNYHAANVMIAASLHTLLFNLNPLMRFDGYHMLADWLELPNLGNHGQAYVKGIAKKVFFGTKPKDLEYAGFHGQVIRLYGIAALAWKVMLCLVLSIAAANLLKGIGVLIAVAASVLWFFMPVSELCKYIAVGTDYEAPNRKRFFGVTGAIAAVLILAGFLLPAPTVVTAPVVVDYEPLNIIRAEAGGFISKIHVTDQQSVQEGDLLLELTSNELESEVARAEFELGKSKLRAKSLQNLGEIGPWQAEQAAVESLQKQLQELVDQKESLQVRAPATGLVIASQLRNDVGKYVTPGTELLSIGCEEQKEAIALVAQNQARHISKSIGQKADLRIWGQSKLKPASFESIVPRTRDDLPHFAFAGVYGGPLNVVQRNQIESHVSETVADNDLMLTQPRVQLRLSLDTETSSQLRAGQVGLVHLRGRSERLGGYLIDVTSRWIKTQVTESHGF